MTDNPRVSVVMPVYNGAPHLARIAPQILGQTLRDFEWIIIDDGSTDETAAAISEIVRSDRRVRALSPGRIGFVPAVNLGIESARGEFIARQDVDDSSEAFRLDVQCQFLQRNPKVGVVGGFYDLINQDRNERFTRMPPIEHDDIIRALPKYIPLAHTLVMFRRQAWRQAGGYMDLPDSEDLQLWIDMAALGWHLANIPIVLGAHLIHADSYWRRTYRYAARYRVQARVQVSAIRKLHLPLWMYVFPATRYGYAYLPNPVKRALRRALVQERDLAMTAAAVSHEFESRP
jgi:glycosyltransferase EpsE